MTPQSNIIHFWRDQDTPNIPRKSPNHFSENVLFNKIQVIENPQLWTYWERRAPKSREAPSNIFQNLEYGINIFKNRYVEWESVC